MKIKAGDFVLFQGKNNQLPSNDFPCIGTCFETLGRVESITRNAVGVNWTNGWSGIYYAEDLIIVSEDNRSVYFDTMLKDIKSILSGLNPKMSANICTTYLSDLSGQFDCRFYLYPGNTFGNENSKVKLIVDLPKKFNNVYKSIW